MSVLDELIRGAYDLHCHVYPEVSLEQEARDDDVALMARAAQAEIGGLVLKSHLWPTVDRAYYLQRQFPGVQVFSSVVLNPIAGGIDPLVVEAAARQGARVMFYPTWQSSNDLEKGGFSRFIRGKLTRYGGGEIASARSVVDGRLTPQAMTCLEAAREFDMTVATGHLSASEGLAVIRAARQLGLRTLYTHPHSASIGATLDQMREAAGLGAYIEFVCLAGISLRGYKPRSEVAQLMHDIGPDQCVLSTDAFNTWAPPMPELLRLGAGQLAECGVSHDDLRRMITDNPRRVLGI